MIEIHSHYLGYLSNKDLIQVNNSDYSFWLGRFEKDSKLTLFILTLFSRYNFNLPSKVIDDLKEKFASNEFKFKTIYI